MPEATQAISSRDRAGVGLMTPRGGLSHLPTLCWQREVRWGGRGGRVPKEELRCGQDVPACIHSSSSSSQVELECKAGESVRSVARGHSVRLCHMDFHLPFL